MKKAQRILVVFVIFLLSLVTVSCSSNGKMSNEELVKKINEVSKSVKSSKAKIESKVTGDIDGQTVTTNLNLDTEETKNPLVVKISGKSETSGSSISRDSISINIYITEEAIYFQNPRSKEWTKTKDENLKKSFEVQKNVANFDNMLELLNALKKNVKVGEKDSSYEITYSGTDDVIKEPLKKILITTQPSAQKVLKNVEVENFDVKYLIDKKTFYQTEFEIKTRLKVSKNSKSIYINAELKAKYSDINEVKEITIPDEAKNAKEWNGN